MAKQPEPLPKKYSDLIADINNGIIRIPKFQRDFVWSLDKTAQLLDSLLKGYPIGTFILWQTKERIHDIDKIGGYELPKPPEGYPVQYVLDGQQRITSLFAAYTAAKIQKSGEKKITDYSQIYVDLDKDIEDDDVQVITGEPPEGRWITLHEVLNFMENFIDIQKRFSAEEVSKIHAYSKAFDTYTFSTVLLNKENIESAIEVFTRINTGGQTLTLFEIMSAKTYDESCGFDMEEKWSSFCKRLTDRKFEDISDSIILSLLSLIISKTKECKRKTILKLTKQDIIAVWNDALSAIEDSIDYLRSSYGVSVSQLLPYDALLVPFSYFFYFKKSQPDILQSKYLEEFFWRVSLSSRYSSASESKLAQDTKRIEQILANERPKYEDMRVLYSSDDLINTDFRASNSYCKAILCLLSAQDPKDFQDNRKVILDNSWLKVANSKNYHHFFPKAYLARNGIENGNSLMNITLVSDHLNKRKIGDRAPSLYIGEFSEENESIKRTLKTHLIDMDQCGIQQDDYVCFLAERARNISQAIDTRINLKGPQQDKNTIADIIKAGESESLEFKETMRFDIKTGEVNKKLEYVIVKTIAAFLNTKGGTLIIGVSDNGDVTGLKPDINSLTKKSIDGFELHLIELVKKFIGTDCTSHLSFSFPDIDDQKICVVKIRKGNRFYFIQHEGREDFFIRAGCSSQPLTREEQHHYKRPE